MLDKISRLVGGPAATAARDATEALRRCYIDCATRALGLARHADMAPQAHSTDALRELAAAEEQQAERFRQALRAADAGLPQIATEALPSRALNHWGRLVQDLEAHRISVRGLRELAARFADTLPTTATLFDQMCREEMAHCERLRALVARADPQALN